MKFINRNIEGAAAKKDVRYVINGVYLAAAASALVATDGHILASIHVDEPGTKSGIIPREAIKHARELNKKAPQMYVSDYKVTTDSGAKFDLIDGKYPDYKRVLPEEKPTVEIALDAKLLLALAKALSPTSTGVKLQISDGKSAVLVKPGDPAHEDDYGLIMPMRI